MITTFKITDQKAIILAECDSFPRIMIIFGHNNVGKSAILYAVTESIIKNVVKKEDVIFISLSGESPQDEEYAGADILRDNPSSRITFVLSRLEVVRRNILADSSLLDNKDRSPIDDYTNISQVYAPLNKLLTVLLPLLKFERVNISNTDSPKCIFSKDIHLSLSHSPNKSTLIN